MYTNTCMVQTWCWSNADSPLAWIQIPKNASTYGELIFKEQLQFDQKLFFDNSDLNNKKIIVFLRHPIERWLSGISQYLFDHHPDIDINDRRLLDFIFSGVIFDEHTFPQAWYLHNMNYDNCVFFNMEDPNFFMNVKDYIFYNAKQVIKDPGTRNVSSENPFKKNIISFLKNAYENNADYFNNVNYKLHVDFVLYPKLVWQTSPRLNVLKNFFQGFEKKLTGNKNYGKH